MERKLYTKCKVFFICDSTETLNRCTCFHLEMACFVHKYSATANKADGRSIMEIRTTLGQLIEVFYSELVKEYGDEELAEVIASTLINEMILAGLHVDGEIAAA